MRAFRVEPKKVMLIDGIGALVSVWLQGRVLVALQEYIGMPVIVLYSLAAVALMYAVYSFGCYFLIPAVTKTHIRIIAFANLIYCGITLMMVALYFEQLTILGVIYFTGEVLVIAGLAIFELKTAVMLHKEAGNHT